MKNEVKQEIRKRLYDDRGRLLLYGTKPEPPPLRNVGGEGPDDAVFVGIFAGIVSALAFLSFLSIALELFQ
jgi:hypothetical protein